jgi:hypothetical protein
MSDGSTSGAERFISHPNTRTLHRGTREDGAECGQPGSEGWAEVGAENPMSAVLNYGTQPCFKCFRTGYHDLERVFLSEHTAVACRYEADEVIDSSRWSVGTRVGQPEGAGDD